MNMFAFTRKIYLIQKMFTFTSIQISDYTAFDHTQHQHRSLIFSPDIAYTAKMSNNGQEQFFVLDIQSLAPIFIGYYPNH